MRPAMRRKSMLLVLPLLLLLTSCLSGAVRWPRWAADLSTRLKCGMEIEEIKGLTDKEIKSSEARRASTKGTRWLKHVPAKTTIDIHGHSAQRGLVSWIRQTGPVGYSGPSNLTNAGTSSMRIQTCWSGGMRPSTFAKKVSHIPSCGFST